MKTAAFVAALMLAGCDMPPDTVETQSAFTCAHFNSFTHLCTQWVPSLIPGSPTNNVPSGNPSWCVPGAALADGWMEVRNDQLVSTGAECARIPPGYYGNLGDWDYASTISGIPSVHVQSFLTGPKAYAFTFSQPNFVGFLGYYPPGSSVIVTPTIVGSIELLLGQ